MPGDPIGMPGTAMPGDRRLFLQQLLHHVGRHVALDDVAADEGRVARLGVGTARGAAALISPTFGTSLTVRSKPACFMCSTHLAQQPQVGDL